MKSFLFFAAWLISCSASAQLSSFSVGHTFRQYVETKGTTGSGSIAVMMAKEETAGSSFLFTDWVPGKVFLKKNYTFQQPDNALNYNKETKNLVLKISDKTIMNIDMNDIEAFELSDSGKTFRFVRFPERHADYFMEIYKGEGCSLYKLVNTKFYKADYINKGQYESGYKYDRYVDLFTYFIRQENGNMIPLEKVNRKELNKVAEVFPEAAEYLKNNPVTADKESFLKNLVMYIGMPAKNKG